MTDDNVHDNVTGMLPNSKNPVTQHSVLMRFSERLRELNRTELLAGGTGDIQTVKDPRDILVHVLALAAGMHSTGQVPSMSLVEALGAQVLALGLAVARVEDGRFDTGDDLGPAA